MMYAENLVGETDAECSNITCKFPKVTINTRKGRVVGLESRHLVEEWINGKLGGGVIIFFSNFQLYCNVYIEIFTFNYFPNHNQTTYLTISCSFCSAP